VPIDDLAEGVVRLLGRALIEFASEVVYEIICYFLGLATLRVATLGAYPPSRTTPRQQTICKLLGLAELVAGAVTAILWLT